MSDEEKLEEVSTPSPVEDTAAPAEPQPDIVQKDIENNRKSIKDTLRAAVEEHKREPSPARQAIAKARPRTEDGKFVPKEDKDSPAEVEQSAPEPTKVPTTAKVAEPAAASSTAPASASSTDVKPPPTWSEEAKATWASIPPIVQQAIAKREKEAADGFANYQTRYQDIDRAFGPQRDHQLQQLGKSRGEAINQLFHWHDALANPQTRVQAFRSLAQSHGIDPATLVPQTGQVQYDPNNPSQFDPLRAVQQTVQPYFQQVDQRTAALEARLQEMLVANETAKLQSFSQDKPHFERVRQRMAQLIGSGAATTLDAAYEQATWGDPEIRAEITAADQAKREADAKAGQEAAQAKAAIAEDERKRKEREAADKARRANISVRSSTAAGMPAAGTSKLGKSVGESLRDSLRDLRA